MAAVSFSNTDLWLVENCKYALDKAKAFGLDDAAIAAITSSGTVAKLITAIEALDAWNSETDTVFKRDIVDVINVAKRGFIPLVNVGTVTPTLHDDSGTGTLSDSLTFYYRVTAVDADGNETFPSPEASQATGTGGAANVHDVALAWTAVEGAASYRVYISQTSETYTGYVAAASNSYSHITDSPTLVTADLPTTNAAKKGVITDAIVETARAAGTIASLINAVADQHPLGTAFRTYTSDLQRHP